MAPIDTALFGPDEFALHFETNAPIDLGRLTGLFGLIEDASREGPIPALGVEILELRSGSLYARFRARYKDGPLSAAQAKRVRKRYQQIMADAGSAVRESDPTVAANLLTAEGNRQVALQTKIMLAALAASIVVPMLQDRPNDMGTAIAEMMEKDGVTCLQVVTGARS